MLCVGRDFRPIRERELEAGAALPHIGCLYNRARPTARRENSITHLDRAHRRPTICRWDVRIQSERLAFDPADDVVRDLDELMGPAEYELTGMNHEFAVVADLDVLGQVARRIAEVDRLDAVVVEDPE